MFGLNEATLLGYYSSGARAGGHVEGVVGVARAVAAAATRRIVEERSQTAARERAAIATARRSRRLTPPARPLTLEARVLAEIARAPSSVAAIAKRLELSRSQVRGALGRLRHKGLARAVSRGTIQHWSAT